MDVETSFLRAILFVCMYYTVLRSRTVNSHRGHLCIKDTFWCTDLHVMAIHFCHSLSIMDKIIYMYSGTPL